MKKICVFVCLLLCAAAVFGQNAVIRELSGTVELKHAGQTVFTAANIGDEVTQSTVVSTGFRSTALIEVGSSVITVRPLTRLSLAEIASAPGTETINVNLQIGRVKVDVNPPLGTRTSMSIRGPNATASVRGTSFEFDTKNLTVESGVVAFQGSSGPVMLVGAGSTSVISSDGKAADPIETGAHSLFPNDIVPDTGTLTGSAPNLGSGTVSVTFTLEFD